MTWYELLLFVHIAGAIVWIGGAFLFQVYGTIELRSQDPRTIARFARNAVELGQAVGRLRARRVHRLVPGRRRRARAHGEGDRGGRPETPEGQRLIRRIFAVLRVDLMFMFAIVFAMVVKPTSDDAWLIVLVAALLVGGAALALRPLASDAAEVSPAG